MANPYLIQALYGPKPPASATGDTGVSGGNPVPALALRPPSLAERLYGMSAVPKFGDEEHIHPDRQNRDQVDGRLRGTLPKGLWSLLTRTRSDERF
jgi:hypothetical protein